MSACQDCGHEEMRRIGHYMTPTGAFLDYFECRSCGWRQPLGSTVTSKWRYAVTVTDSGQHERFAHLRIKTYETREEAERVIEQLKSLGYYTLIERYGAAFQFWVCKILCWANTGDPQTITEFYDAYDD